MRTAVQISDRKSKWQKKLHLSPLLKIMKEKSQEIASIFTFFLNFSFKLLTHPRLQDDIQALQRNH